MDDDYLSVEHQFEIEKDKVIYEIINNKNKSKDITDKEVIKILKSKYIKKNKN